MSLVNLLRGKNRKLLFTTPSHSQKFFIFHKFKQFYKYDISETDAYDPQSALEKAQNNAAKIYGTKQTCFLTNGSKSGIIASVLACTQKGDKVLIWNNAHPSYLNAVKLAGCEPVYYELPIIKEWGVPDRTTPDLIDIKGVKAVIVTSPTYEGIVSDIKDKCIIKNVAIRDNIFGILEDNCTVIYYPLENEKNRGFHIKRIVKNELEDFVYINTAKPIAEQIFAAAHEFGHIFEVSDKVWKMMEYSGFPTEEDEENITNRFAAELLMPAEVFKQSFFGKHEGIGNKKRKGESR